MQEPTKLGSSDIALTQQKSQFPHSYLFGLSPCHCNDTANPFNKLTLADDGQIFHSSCL